MEQRTAQFKAEEGLYYISQSYKKYGLHRDGDMIVYREWAPEAAAVSIFGDFNGWNRNEYHCQKVFGRIIRMSSVYGFATSINKSNSTVQSRSKSD